MLKETVSGLLNILRPYVDNLSDYLTIDVETTGLNTSSDLIVQIGYSLIKNDKMVENQAFTLDWTYNKGIISEEQLKAKLIEVKNHVEVRDGVHTGRTYHMSFEKMATEGVPPSEVLRLFDELFTDNRRNRSFIVMHNGYNFDVPVLESHFRRFTGPTAFKFADNEVFDSGTTEKGAQMEAVPTNKDTLRSYSDRIYKKRRKGLRWSLDGYCIPHYDLEKKYNLDKFFAHDAGFDSLVTSCLFQEYKKIASTDGELRVDDPF